MRVEHVVFCVFAINCVFVGVGVLVLVALRRLSGIFL